jgi:hypothetical protein
VTATRAQLLKRGLLGAAAIAASGGGLARAAVAAPAASVPDADLAYLRLLAATELLKADFETKALASQRLRTRSRALARRVQAADRAHYRALATLTTDAGQQPPSSGDIDYSYPARTFATEASVLALAGELTTLTLGAYLGAIENVQTPALRLAFGQIAANEARQLSAFAGAAGRIALGNAFATALPIDAVSAQLDRFES